MAKDLDDGALARGEIIVTGRRKSERHDGMTAAKRKTFLNVLAETCCVQRATAAAGPTASSVYSLRRRDAAFAIEWQEALSIGYDNVEAKLLDYVMTRGVDADGQAQPIADRVAPGSGLPPGQAPAWVQVALQLLARHRATAEGRRSTMKLGKRATPEQTDATLTRRLDILARSLKDKA